MAVTVEQIHVARQPILDTRQQVFGYELLYRAAATDTAAPTLDASISARVIGDALLGIGSTRALDGPLRAAVLQINASGKACLAVDLPTGLSAQTGQLLGDVAVRASATLNLLTLRPGLLTAAGRAHVGDLWFDSLACEADRGVAPVAMTGAADRWAALPLVRQHDAHKGVFGDVLIIGGAPGMTGAARLAGHAAVAAGAGRTLVSLLDPAADAADPARPEWLSRAAAWEEPTLIASATVVIGCGGGGDVAAALPNILEGAPRLVVDADALNALASTPALREQVARRRARGQATVLTPHPLEAARLLGCTTAEVQGDRIGAATRICQDLQSVVALKGSGTVTAAPGLWPVVNLSGSAALSTGGTGDVLAGWLGGLWSCLAAARPDDQDTSSWAAQVTAGVVWLHGLAGEARAPVRGLDLVETMRRLAWPESS